MEQIRKTVDYLNKQTSAEKVLTSFAVAAVLTTLSIIVGYTSGWVTDLNFLEILAVLTSYSCTYLFVVQTRACYIIGVITTILYTILFYQWNLLGSAVVNAYLSFQLLYGWFRWGRDDQTRPVTFIDWKWWPVYLIVSSATYLGAAGIISWFGGTYAPWDAGIMFGTILAQFLLDNKKLETWLIWAIVNVAAITLYSTQGLYLVAFQYVFFLLNTIYGYYSWNRTRIGYDFKID